MRTVPKFKIHPSTLFLLLSLIILDRTALSLIPILAAAIHELGHLAVMSLLGVHIGEIEITLLGADIKALPYNLGDFGRISVLSAGALGNFLTAASAALFFNGNCALFFSACSVFLGLFNLLPIKTLDGGCIAEVICRRLFPYRCEAVTSALSACSLFILWAFAVYLILNFGGNISLLLFCIYMFATLYMRCV